MRLLVTGGFGYVGGRLAQRLRASGHEVVLGSRATAVAPAWLPDTDVVAMAWHDLGGLRAVCDGIDGIVHAAGMNAGDCQADPVGALEFNGVATARLTRAAIETGVTRFIYLSTAHVYARPLTGHVAENDLPQNPHPYATSHLAGENALRSTCDDGRLDGTIVRLSNAIGEPTATAVNCWMLLFCDLCRQAVTGGALTLRTNSLQQRDFVALDDVCAALEMLLQRTTSDLGATIFNIGSGKSMTLLSLAELIQARCHALFGSRPEILELQSQAASSGLDFDIGRLRAAGYKPVNDFVTETDRMLQFCRQAFAPNL